VGQVPKIGLIGRGRAARHLNYYFNQSGIALQNWHRGSPVQELSKLNDCDLVILAISDSQIDEFFYNFSLQPGQEIIHLSGAHVTQFKCLHPLASFGSTLFDLKFYKKMIFVTEAENPFDFKKYFPQLSNPVFKISKHQKPRYHALCVAANNFSTMLWQKYFKSLEEEFGIAPEYSSSLLESTLRNLKSDWANSLTGPLARGDFETVEKNMAALEGDSLRIIYLAFVQNFQSLRNQKINYTYLEPGEMGL